LSIYCTYFIRIIDSRQATDDEEVPAMGKLLGLVVVVYLLVHLVHLGYHDGVLSLRVEQSVRSLCESVLRSCELDLRVSGQ
jgi:hypothetical protein